MFISPLKIIRAKCLDCSCGQQSEVRLCPVKRCPLWPFRMGHNPTTNRKGGKPPLSRRKSAPNVEVGLPDHHAPTP